MSTNPNMQTRPLPDMEWDDEVYVIHDRHKQRAVGHHRTLLLMHDPNRELDRQLCNISRVDGMVCRMMKGHDGRHVPFTGEHISTVGVYVAAVEPTSKQDRA